MLYVNPNKENYMKSTTKIALYSVAQFLLFVAFVLNGAYMYQKYTDGQDAYKKQCFDKFGFFDFEVVSDDLYCKSGGKSIKLAKVNQ